MTPGNQKKNLILIPDLLHHERKDFDIIASKIRAKCNDIVPFVVKRRWLKYLQYPLAIRPSLYVGFLTINNWEPIRGKLLCGKNFSKSHQYFLISQENLPYLKWWQLEKDTILDREYWGDYVVVKPEYGRKGEDVRLVKTKDVEHNPNSKEVIQEFIDTGDPPESYRVCTLFGECLYCVHLMGPEKKTNNIHHHTGRRAITSQRGKKKLSSDNEIIAIANEMARKAFPEIPVLGLDMVRSKSTGGIYCLEANPFGKTWHFSSELGKKVMNQEGFSFADQYKAFDKAADILILKARALAI